jgi:hypothetical protein
MFDTLVQIDPRLLGAVTTVLTLGTTLLGLAVGYIAFRGYRQGSRPMKFVAVGFLLVFWAPVLLFVGNLLVPGLPEFALGVLGEGSRFVGLSCILYGLWTPNERE